uniref:Serine/threonine-protein phosphatase n=1 Tax=Zooxanthella nutricula TaxID=1333877 RepID=A0A7S2QNK6_9DINO
MVWKMNEKSRYPGDPQGQAWVGGVRTGYAIKAIAGTDVSKWDFWDIMDLIDDKILDNSAGKFQAKGKGGMANSPAALPLTIEYAVFKQEMAPESSAAVADNGGSYVDRNDPRYRDLPPDATLQEYKIPPAPASYTSPDVEQLRAYVRTLPEPAGYAGPRYRGPGTIDKAFVDTMIANFKNGQLLPIKDAYQMAIDVFDILVKEKTLGRVPVPEGKKVTVIGDLHGQLFDFAHMLTLIGYPSPDNPFVFNGDFVDRGPWSVEVMFSLLAFKLMHPQHVFMNRGNHESEMANHFYGFFGEVEAKYEKKMCPLFAEIFRATPLCHVLNNEVFVVHGGIPGPDPRVWWKGINNQVGFSGRTIEISLAEIENSNRFMEPNPKENPLMVDLLWSDPKGKIGYGPSGRMSEGIYLFGPDVSEAFMRNNNLKMCLRSHEVKAQGYRYDHEGQFPVITVFSAPNYVDKAGNKAAVAVMTNRGGSLQGPEFIQFDAQPHPPVPSGAYAAGGPLHPDTVAAPR